MVLSKETYRGLLDAKTRVLNDEEQKWLVQILLSSKADKEHQDRVWEELKSEHMAAFIMHDRLTRVGLINQVEKALLVWIACLCNTPGDAVMWSYTLCRMYDNGDDLTPERWCFVFPDGVPAEEEKKRIWDEQKDKDAPMSNWLDKMEWR